MWEESGYLHAEGMVLLMEQHPPPPTWVGWSVISPDHAPNFTLWYTGLPGTGKTTLASLVRQNLLARGYQAEIIDRHALTHWLQQEMHLDENITHDQSHTLGYDAFISYLCTLLTRNGIISITTSVSPYREARKYAREHLTPFIEIYLFCASAVRQDRLRRMEHLPQIDEQLYQPPLFAELNINTELELPERSALRIIDYLEQHSYITPLWEEPYREENEEEIDTIKARLRALGYLE